MATVPPAERSARPATVRRLPIPVPWNAELLFYLLVELGIAILCFAFESVNGEDFFEVTKWISAAYLLSRGIAKAGRVLESGSE